LGFIFMRCN